MAISPEEFGPYVVYEQLGLGGMATVHRAETQGIAGFSKQVALKRMLPNVAADANLVKSFIREARLASNLHHANVAQTYDLGKVGETYFIAMELVPGRNLREILKHCLAIGTPVPTPIALNIITQICDALDYAHNLCDESGTALGIIHRDVSPSNIILGEGGIAKLIDFGIAKAAASHHTLAGTIKGKFSYMAPEYLDGFLDARADLFALGVIAHELLANKPLFQGRDDMDTLFRIKEMPLIEPSQFNPDVPPEIDSIVMTALSRDPEKRWQSAGALRNVLATEAQRLGIVAHNADVAAWVDRAFERAGTESPEISIGEGTAVLPEGSNEKPAWGRVPTNTEHATKELRVGKPKSIPPRNQEFDETPATRADAAAIDSIAASPLARRDNNVFDTPTIVAAVSTKDLVKSSEDSDVIEDDLPTMATPSARPTPPPRQSPRPSPQPRPTPQPRQSPTPRPTPPPPRPTPKPPTAAARPIPRELALPDDDDESVSTIEQPVETTERPVSTLERPMTSHAPVARPVAPAGWASRYLLTVLVLIAAGGAAAVVYFALP